VIPARLFGQKASGGKLEVLVERVLDSHRVLAHVRSSKSPKPGSKILIDGGGEAEMVARHDALFELKFAEEVLPLLERVGHMPLPPYIDRPDEDSDRERYQTVYSHEDERRYQTVFAKHPGAAAAPTAALHFDEGVLQGLEAQGVSRASVTLHVGAGTFQPVKTENLAEHRMHSEWYDVPAAPLQAIADCRARGGRVVAVGTTSVRTLESWAKNGLTSGDTDIFITPGFAYQVVDVLLTNFHLPKSTLMMLVSAFAGYEHIMALYRHAIAQHYRFFSYGDAMLLARSPASATPPAL